MNANLEISKDSVILLCKGGYLPARRLLTDEQKDANTVHHVDLMLRTVRDHGMRRLEGFRFLAPQQPWERFWIAEFPDFEGAEAYVEAEMAPPSGPLAYHEYYMARRWRMDYFDSWVTNPRQPITTPPNAPDPHNVLTLLADLNSVVVLAFVRWLPEAELVVSEKGRAAYESRMRTVASEHGLRWPWKRTVSWLHRPAGATCGWLSSPTRAVRKPGWTPSRLHPALVTASRSCTWPPGGLHSTSPSGQRARPNPHLFEGRPHSLAIVIIQVISEGHPFDYAQCRLSASRKRCSPLCTRLIIGLVDPVSPT